MAVTVVQVVGVILVRHGDVAAPLTVLVVAGGMTGSGALVDMAAVNPVHRPGNGACTDAADRIQSDRTGPALAPCAWKPIGLR
ncbi:hypothetical protein [Streptomyces coeruleorubidus]|uniref:hypothetical protein n=1 Tax=Streptomyces coeruleorubidus TaxID=116188 RepID=UPI0037A48441